MIRLKVFLVGVLARLVGLAKGGKWRRSLGHEDDVLHMDLEEKLFWFYKSTVRQVELAEPGSGFEERFAGQNLDFTPPASFRKETSVIISAGGDLSAMELITPDNTARLWDEVGGFLFGRAAETAPLIAVANLETPIRPSEPAVGVPAVCLAAPALNGSAAMFERFQSGGGFGYLATANNHSYDQGAEGIAETLDFLDVRGVAHSGTARVPEERDAFPIIERGGIRVAFLSWTYCLNGRLLPEGQEHLANVARLNKAGFDVAPLAAQAKAARERGADFVVAVLHWSVEFEAYPTKDVADSARRIAEAGVDLILGGPPHNAQPSERLVVRDPETGHEREALVIYSLGELVALNLHTKNSRLAQLVRVELSVGIEEGRKASRITSFEILPIATSYRRIRSGAGQAAAEYRVLDLRATLASLDRGENPEGYSKREIRELRRLYALATRTMLPADARVILAPAGVWRKH